MHTLIGRYACLIYSDSGVQPTKSLPREFFFFFRRRFQSKFAFCVLIESIIALFKLLKRKECVVYYKCLFSRFRHIAPLRVFKIPKLNDNKELIMRRLICNFLVNFFFVFYVKIPLVWNERSANFGLRPGNY